MRERGSRDTGDDSVFRLSLVVLKIVIKAIPEKKSFVF